MVEEVCDASSCTLSPAPSSGTSSPAGPSPGTNISSKSGSSSTSAVLSTAANNTLPPCRVCGEKASGFHYGVNTCEACKGFFRRSLQRKDKYKCLGSGQCKIGVGRRSNCPSCRYHKCLKVGMSKSAIKTGRYTHEKRTQDILEVKQMQLSKERSHGFIPPTESGQRNFQTSSSKPTPTSSATPASLTTTASIPTTASLHATATSFDLDQTSGSPEQYSVSHQIPSSTSQQAQGLASNPVSSSDSIMDSNSDQAHLPPPPSAVPVFDSAITSSSPVSSAFSDPVTTTMTPSPVPGTSSTPSSEAGDLSLSPWTPSPGDNGQTYPRYSHDERLPSMMPLAVPMPMPPTPPEDPDDLDSIASMLVEAHKKNVFSHTFCDFDVILERQAKYAEEFRRKEEMFGTLSTLPQEQYMEIFEKTGMDVDNRQEMIKFFASQMESGMKRYITFVKNIPGFSELPIDDQAALVKAARYEFWFCGSFPGYNSRLNVVSLPSGKNLHLKEMSKIWDQDFVIETFRLARTFQRLPLLPEELVLVKCLCVTFSDRCELKNQSKVEAIQWKLTQCLLHLLKRNHTHCLSVFARIIDRLTELRSLTEWNYKIARNLQIWPAIHQSPLMMEMFSV